MLICIHWFIFSCLFYGITKVCFQGAFYINYNTKKLVPRLCVCFTAVTVFQGARLLGAHCTSYLIHCMYVRSIHLTGVILHVNLTFPATEAAPEYFTVACKYTGIRSVKCVPTQYSLLCHSLQTRKHMYKCTRISLLSLKNTK